jgi:hypothetical protein
MATDTLTRQIAAIVRQESAQSAVELASRTLALDEREAELERREVELAAALEAFTAAKQDSAIWADATAAERLRWLALVDNQLQWFRPDGTVATVLGRLRNAGGDTP